MKRLNFYCLSKSHTIHLASTILNFCSPTAHPACLSDLTCLLVLFICHFLLTLLQCTQVHVVFTRLISGSIAHSRRHTNLKPRLWKKLVIIFACLSLSLFLFLSFTFFLASTFWLLLTIFRWNQREIKRYYRLTQRKNNMSVNHGSLVHNFSRIASSNIQGKRKRGEKERSRDTNCVECLISSCIYSRATQQYHISDSRHSLISYVKKLS